MNFKNLKTLADVQREYYSSRRSEQGAAAAPDDGAPGDAPRDERPRMRMRALACSEDRRTSRLVRQFYAHRLPGAESDDARELRLLLQRQQRLEREARNAADLVSSALAKLSSAFPRNQAAADGAPGAPDDGASEHALKCSSRFLESSIAVMLEHMDGLPVHFASADSEKLLLP